MATAILIPARGGSKGIPGKNMKLFNGVPLVSRAIRTALSLGTYEVYVSSDCETILKEAEAEGAVPILRPTELSGDHSTTEECISHFAAQNDFTDLVLMQATSPFTRDLDIAAVIYQLIDFDSVLTVTDHAPFIWNTKTREPVNYNPRSRPMRQQRHEVSENGALYATTRRAWERSQCRISGRVGFHPMPAWKSIEIDEPADWIFAETLAEAMR